MAGTGFFGARFSRRDIGTVVRAIGCILLFWVFLLGTSWLSLRGPVVLAVATALSLLAAYELTLREVAPGLVLLHSWHSGCDGRRLTDLALFSATGADRPLDRARRAAAAAGVQPGAGSG